MKSVWIFSHYAAPPKYSGALRHYNFAKQLIEKGYDVKVFANSAIHNSDANMIEGKERVEEKILDDVPFVLIKARNYKGNGIKRLLNLYDYKRGLKKAIRKMAAPDIIFANVQPLFIGPFALKAAKKRNVPCVCEVLDLWPQSIVEHMNIKASNPLIKHMYKQEKAIYKNADAMVFSIEGGYDYIINQGWQNEIDAKKVFHINMGIDIKQHDKDLVDHQFTNEWLSDSKTFKVVYCGSIRTANHVKTMIDAAKMLENTHKDIVFLIYGDGDQKEELQRYAKENNIKNVMFGGRIPKQNLPCLLACADLNLLNYKAVDLWKYGGSQSKLFDYLASGKPILTNIHMGYSLLERYHCGFETENQTTQGLYDGILKMYNLSGKEREDMGRRARQAAEDYDQPILADQLVEVLHYAQNVSKCKK